MILALCGNLGSGKDTVASILQIYGFVPIGFADALKQLVGSIFPFSEGTLFGPSDKRNAKDPYACLDSYWDEVLGQIPFAGPKVLRLFPHLDFNEVLLSLKEFVHQIRREAIFQKEPYADGLSARQILQQIGTEWARSLDDQVWVKLLKTPLTAS